MMNYNIDISDSGLDLIKCVSKNKCPPDLNPSTYIY